MQNIFFILLKFLVVLGAIAFLAISISPSATSTPREIDSEFVRFNDGMTLLNDKGWSVIIDVEYKRNVVDTSSCTIFLTANTVVEYITKISQELPDSCMCDFSYSNE